MFIFNKSQVGPLVKLYNSKSCYLPALILINSKPTSNPMYQYIGRFFVHSPSIILNIFINVQTTIQWFTHQNHQNEAKMQIIHTQIFPSALVWWWWKCESHRRMMMRWWPPMDPYHRSHSSVCVVMVPTTCTSTILGSFHYNVLAQNFHFLGQNYSIKLGLKHNYGKLGSLWNMRFF